MRLNPTAATHTTSSFNRYLLALRWVGLAALVALALTPLILDPAARDDAYFGPKWAWLASWTALGVAAVAARALAGRVATFPLNEIWIGSLLFALWHWVAVLWARSSSLAFERAAQVTWLTLALWLGLQLFTRRRALLWIGWAWIGVGVVTALWVLVEDAVHAWFPSHGWIVSNLGDWRGYLAAGLGNTSHIGDLTALALIPTLMLFGEARRPLVRLFLFFAALILPAGLIVSFSVGSNFGLIAGTALMAGLVFWRLGARWFMRRKGRWIALALAWAALVVFFVAPHPANPHRNGIFNEAFDSKRWKDGGPTRLAIWAESLDMIRLHPLGGVGPGNFTYVFPEMDSRLIWDRPDLRIYQGLYTNAAHNEFLQQWSELGLPGLFLFMALLGLAFYALLKDLRWCDRPSFLTRATLAALLLAWLVQAQMNFSLQHPAGALTFYTLLLAAALEKRSRPAGPDFPSLSMENGPLIIRIDVKSMTQPTAFGAALSLPRWLAAGLGATVLAGALGWAVTQPWRPVRAQNEYARAVNAELISPDMANARYRRVIEIDPDMTNARSHYSDWLIKQGRAAEGLAELKVVRRRLNSNELWEREARGLAALGKTDEARKAMDTFYKRLWQARLMNSAR